MKKLNEVDALVGLAILTLMSGLIMKFIDISLVRFIFATLTSMTVTLSIVVFVDSVKDIKKGGDVEE